MRDSGASGRDFLPFGKPPSLGRKAQIQSGGGRPLWHSVRTLVEHHDNSEKCQNPTSRCELIHIPDQANPTESERKQIDHSYIEFLAATRRETILSELMKAQAD